MKNPLIINAWFVVALLLAVALLWCLESDGQAQEPHVLRYRIMQNQLVFENADELPYQVIRPMCWNESTGWCDAGMEDAGHRLFYLIDFLTGKHGVVMENDAGCWLWWFYPEYGADEQPHVDEHSWIECP